MADTTLPKDELKSRPVEGAPLSQGEVSAIESEETNRTGFGPVKGGPAVTVQSIHANIAKDTLFLHALLYSLC
jgi:hypothetical protein